MEYNNHVEFSDEQHKRLDDIADNLVIVGFNPETIGMGTAIAATNPRMLGLLEMLLCEHNRNKRETILEDIKKCIDETKLAGPG